MRTRIFGLRMAARELGNPCHNHAKMVDRMWKFCPWCGMVLKFIKTCPTCGKRFLSHKAFVFHAQIHKNTTQCPNCGSKHIRRETPTKRRGFSTYTHFNQTRSGGKYIHCLDCNWVWDWRSGEGKKILLERTYQ